MIGSESRNLCLSQKRQMISEPATSAQPPFQRRSQLTKTILHLRAGYELGLLSRHSRLFCLAEVLEGLSCVIEVLEGLYCLFEVLEGLAFQSEVLEILEGLSCLSEVKGCLL